MSLLSRSNMSLNWPGWRMNRQMFPWADMWEGITTDFEVRIEEFESDGDFVIRAEIPGLDPDKDVELTVHNSQLHLKFHRERHDKSAGSRHFRSEFQYGSFTRIVSLPLSASEKDVKATYRQGILEVRVRMNGTPDRSQRIPITNEESATQAKSMAQGAQLQHDAQPQSRDDSQSGQAPRGDGSQDDRDRQGRLDAQGGIAAGGVDVHGEVHAKGRPAEG